MPAAISFRDVSYTTLFEGLSFNIEAGCSALVITSREDESSALLRLITGMSPPLRGSVHVSGQAVNTLAPEQLYHLRQAIGIIPSQGGLISNLKMWENITLPILYTASIMSDIDIEHALDYLKKLNYSGSVMALPAHLSLHEKRIAAFVRSALLKPRLMVYCNCLEGITASARKNFINVADEFHRAEPGRTSLFLASSAEVGRELPVDMQVTVHEPSNERETHDT